MLTEQEIASLNREDMRNILSESYKSTKVFTKVFLPEHFTRPYAGFHDEIFALLDNSSIKKKLIVAPRGVGKSTIANLAFPLKKILFGDYKYQVPISLSYTAAEEQSENVKKELVQNDLIRKFFGNLKSDAWAKDKWITKTGIKVTPIGSNQQIRGKKFGNIRPQLIGMDDIENKEMQYSEERMSKLIRWVNNDVCNSIDRGSDNWEIFLIGSLLGPHSLVQKLLGSNDWEKLVISICGDDYKSRWPEFISDPALAQLVESQRNDGMLAEFCLEYMSRSVPPGDGDFRPEYFKYYDEADLTPADRRYLVNIILVDPAKTASPASCDSAVVCWGYHPLKNRLYFRDCLFGKFHQDQLFEAILSMGKFYNTRSIGIEVTSLHEHVVYPLKTAMAQSGRIFDIIELHAREKKELRIAGLIPFFRRGMIYLNKSVSLPLETQLISFPYGSRVDIADAASYIVKILDMQLRYFQAAFDEQFENEEDQRMSLDKDFDDELSVPNSYRMPKKWQLC